jgi:hypothetical protein
MAWHGMAWHGMAWHGMAWYGMDWYGIYIVLHGLVWYGMVWYIVWRVCVCAVPSAERVGARGGGVGRWVGGEMFKEARSPAARVVETPSMRFRGT